MACAKDADCSICTSNFDSGQRQAVELPCGHEFCLSCLVNLRVSGKHKCPRCRNNWADMDVRALPVMGALAAALDRDIEEEENDLGKKKKVDGFCKKHLLPFDFWVKEEKEFYCKKCAAKRLNVTLELIEDAIPDIKATLGKEAQDAGKKVKEELKLLDISDKKIEDSWNKVKKFKKLVDTLDKQFNDCSRENRSSKLTLTKSLELIKKVEDKAATIANEADVEVVLKSRTTLQQCTGTSSLPSSHPPETLLFDIVDSYMKNTKPDRKPTREAFVAQLRPSTPVKQQTAASYLSSSIFAVDPRPELNSMMNMKTDTLTRGEAHLAQIWGSTPVKQQTAASSLIEDPDEFSFPLPYYAYRPGGL